MQEINYIVDIVVIVVSGTVTMFLQWWRKNRDEDDVFDLRQHWKSIALFFGIGAIANIVAYFQGRDPSLIFDLVLGLSGLNIQFAANGVQRTITGLNNKK